MLTSLPSTGAPIIILGGMFTGIVTPTEAAALAVVYTLLVGLIVYRTIRPRDLPSLCIRAGRTSGTVLLIMMVAGIATYVFTVDGLPRQVTAAINQQQDQRGIVGPGDNAWANGMRTLSPKPRRADRK